MQFLLYYALIVDLIDKVEYKLFCIFGYYQSVLLLCMLL